MTYWLPYLAVLGGFIGLIWSADRFVAGSAAIARNFGVSKLVIGLTIVSLGTSAPEIVVSISASLDGAGDLAVGNAIGSNLANIGLVLAITALIAPLPIQRHLMTQEIPALMIVTLVGGLFVMDGTLVLWEGLVLLLLLAPLLASMIWFKKKHPDTVEDTDIENLRTASAWLWFFVGLVVLIATSRLLVWGATEIAMDWGVSPLVIGLTVIAIGTSLPELAASVASALKQHHDIALGNIVGSNIFNLLAVMSLPGLFAPLHMENAVFYRDYLSMAAITLLLVAAILFSYFMRRDKSHTHTVLGRRIGVLLLLGYAGYCYILFGQQLS